MGLMTPFERQSFFEILDHFWTLRKKKVVASVPKVTLYHERDKGVS